MYNPYTSPKESAMYDRKKLDELKSSLDKWEKTSLQKALALNNLATKKEIPCYTF